MHAMSSEKGFGLGDGTEKKKKKEKKKTESVGIPQLFFATPTKKKSQPFDLSCFLLALVGLFHDELHDGLECLVWPKLSENPRHVGSDVR